MDLYCLRYGKEAQLQPGIGFCLETGGNKESKLFINFQMTVRRSSIMIEIRQLKKQGNLYKQGSDENGNIWIQALV